MSSNASISGRLQRADVESYPLDDDLVLYHATSREGFILNGTGKRIWELADGSNTVTMIARTLSREYGISYEAAKTDTEELLTNLSRAGLVVRVKKPRGGSG